MSLGISDFMRKFSSIPESEPLYKILKSRTIDLSKIKDKNEKKYWSELKRINEIPSEYFSTTEVIEELQRKTKENNL